METTVSETLQQSGRICVSPTHHSFGCLVTFCQKARIPRCQSKSHCAAVIAALQGGPAGSPPSEMSMNAESRPVMSNITFYCSLLLWSNWTCVQLLTFFWFVFGCFDLVLLQPPVVKFVSCRIHCQCWIWIRNIHSHHPFIPIVENSRYIFL